MAIDGIYSHWITDDILAMARPNKAAMEKHGMVDKFKVNNNNNNHHLIRYDLYYIVFVKILEPDKVDECLF